MDTRELASNQYFDDEIRRQIASSGIFLALTSPGYLHPESYCRKELTEFCRKAQQPPESLRVGTRSRLVTALLYNIDHSEWPTEYAGLTSAQLFDTSQTEFGDPTRIRSELFEDQIKKLARETCELLEEYKKSFVTSAPPTPAVKKTRVFLADTVESLSELRSCVTNALNKEGIEIFQRMPPPYEVEAHDRTAIERIAACDLSVHLFDATPGEKFIEGDSGKTFLQRQAELGLGIPKPQFLWVPPKTLVDIPLIQDQGYRDFLAGLENGERDKSSYTFQRDPVNAVPEEIIKRIKELQTPPTRTIASSALLETHRKDQLHALDLYPLLLQKALQPYINPDDDDPGENVSTFQRLVSQISVLIIIFGSVASDWVQERLISSLQLAATLEPRRHLASSLLETVSGTQNPDASAELAKQLRLQGTEAVAQLLKSKLNETEANLILVVDQFEELFRYNQPQVQGGPPQNSNQSPEERQRCVAAGREARRDEAASFVSTILELTRQSEFPVYVVITMRSDFLGDCDAFHGLPEAINESIYLVPRLNRQQRIEAIESPIKLYGETISPRLLDLVTNDVGEESDQLPVMQHALMRTWEKWKEDIEYHGPIDLPHYEAAGMISEALSRDADRALREVRGNNRNVAKRMFEALVETDVQGRNTRRPAHLNQIAEIAEVTPKKVLEIVDHFRREGRCFLSLSSEIVSDDPMIDISHESLIRQWAQLRDWVKSENYSKEQYLELSAAARRHANGGALYADTALQLALDWWNSREPNQAWSFRYNDEFEAAKEFLTDSKEKHDRDLKAREEQRLRELETARIQEQNERLRRYIYALVIISLLAVGSLGATAVSFVKARSNEKLAVERGEDARKSAEIASVEQKKAADAAGKLQVSLIEAQQAKEEATEQSRLAIEAGHRADEQKRIAEMKAKEALRLKQEALGQADLARSASERASQSAALATSRLHLVEQAKEDLRVANERSVEALKKERTDVIARLGEKYQKAISLTGDSKTIDEARKNYEEILGIYDEQGVRGGRLSTLLVLGRLYDGSLIAKAPERALDYYSHALPLFNASDPAERNKKIETLIKMGDLQYGKTGTQPAATRYEEALELGYQPAGGDNRNVYVKLANFYSTQTNRDNLDRALSFYTLTLRDAEEKLRSDQHEESSTRAAAQTKLSTLIKLGTVDIRLGKRQEGTQSYDKAMSFAVAPPLEQSAWEPLIAIATSLDRPEETVNRAEYLRRAVEIAGPDEKATVYKRVGDLLVSLDQAREGISYLQQAERLTASKDPITNALVLRSTGAAYEKLGQKDEALTYYHRALAAYEKLKLSTRTLKARIDTLESVQK